MRITLALRLCVLALPPLGALAQAVVYEGFNGYTAGAAVVVSGGTPFQNTTGLGSGPSGATNILLPPSTVGGQNWNQNYTNGNSFKTGATTALFTSGGLSFPGLATAGGAAISGSTASGNGNAIALLSTPIGLDSGQTYYYSFLVRTGSANFSAGSAGFLVAGASGQVGSTTNVLSSGTLGGLVNKGTGVEFMAPAFAANNTSSSATNGNATLATLDTTYLIIGQVVFSATPGQDTISYNAYSANDTVPSVWTAPTNPAFTATGTFLLSGTGTANVFDALRLSLSPSYDSGLATGSAAAALTIDEFRLDSTYAAIATSQAIPEPATWLALLLGALLLPLFRHLNRTHS